MSDMDTNMADMDTNMADMDTNPVTFNLEGYRKLGPYPFFFADIRKPFWGR
ncbi:hypothetical protein BgiMline_005022, partial [Biomphalaria glabrata]